MILKMLHNVYQHITFRSSAATISVNFLNKMWIQRVNDAYNNSYIEISWYDVSPLSFLI